MLTSPIKPKDFEKIWINFLLFNPELKAIVDITCKDISRAYYLFSHPQSRANIAQCCVLLGKPINPAHFMTPRKVKSIEPFLFENLGTPLSKLIHGGIKEGARNAALASYVGGLINKGLDKEQTRVFASEWNQSLEPPLDDYELQKTHNSIWNTHLRNNPESQIKSKEGVSKVFNYKLIPSSQFLASEPPKREYVIDNLIPKKIVATIIAAGGTGKSFLAMHFAVSAASGSSLFGKFLPSKPNKVVFISGEDDSSELQRRLHKVVNSMPPNVKNTVSNNLHFIDLADAF
jgi:hypothetical protein